MPKSPSPSKLICDCCGQDEAIGVASSPLGAISHAWCNPCLQDNVVPLSDFEYVYDFVSDDGAHMADWVEQLSTYREGKKITWKEYVELRHTFPLCDKHNTHMDGETCMICSYEEATSSAQDMTRDMIDDGTFQEIQPTKG